ncbi:uncharacterized protein LOC117649996 [Thrips palmi]|uniref:Uncharacterized protein LOC117649996 n=1 Tax=Thrips palmi TaxID=161013 RepID=A0A6P8ZUY8_THRPL|nr:uncharacterized protein LOC117649996 [Thrips palmi]
MRLPVYTRVDKAVTMSASSLKWWVAVLGLVVALAPAPSSLSLALHVDVGHSVGHQHPVDLEQWSQRSPGDVRCYCNLPACITTGYMCKSAGRGCFSDLVDHVDVYRARHGCLDLLDSGRQQQCKNQPRPPSDQDADDVPAWEQDAALAAPQDAVEAVPQDTAVEEAPPQPQDAVRPRATQDTPSLLLCCTDDMCNHIDSPDSRMRHSGPNGSDTHVTMSSPAGVVVPPGAVAGPSVSSSESAAAAAAAARSAELWFKAATIAVPICGALILVLLIVLAVRLLRADSQHQRASKLSACAFPALSDKKVPLLPCGTGVGWGHGVNRLGSDCSLPPGLPPKNHTLAKLNYTASYDLLDLHRDAPHLANNNQRNVLLGNAPRVHAKSSYKQVLASFVPWASAASGSDPPTNV